VSTTPAPTPSTPSPWVVEQSGLQPVPIGSYFATFEDVAPFSNDKVTDKMRFTWKIALADPNQAKSLLP
jgi:hypothetical protein